MRRKFRLMRPVEVPHHPALLDWESLGEIAKVAHLYAHPLRLPILDFLATTSSPQCVTEIIAASAETRQAVVSQQLKILRERGLLQAERRGNKIYYSLLSHADLSFLHYIRVYIGSQL